MPGSFACLCDRLSYFFLAAFFAGAFFAGAFFAAFLAAFFAGAFFAAAFLAGDFFAAAFFTANVVPRLVDFLLTALFLLITDFLVTLPPLRALLLLFLAADFFAAFLAGAFATAFFAAGFLAAAFLAAAFFTAFLAKAFFRWSFLGWSFLGRCFFRRSFLCRSGGACCYGCRRSGGLFFLVVVRQVFIIVRGDHDADLFFLFFIVVKTFHVFQGLVFFRFEFAVVLCVKFSIVLHSYASHGVGVFRFLLHSVALIAHLPIARIIATACNGTRVNASKK